MDSSKEDVVDEKSVWIDILGKLSLHYEEKRQALVEHHTKLLNVFEWQVNLLTEVTQVDCPPLLSIRIHPVLRFLRT